MIKRFKRERVANKVIRLHEFANGARMASWTAGIVGFGAGVASRTAGAGALLAYFPVSAAANQLQYRFLRKLVGKRKMAERVRTEIGPQNRKLLDVFNPRTQHVLLALQTFAPLPKTQHALIDKALRQLFSLQGQATQKQRNRRFLRFNQILLRTFVNHASHYSASTRSAVRELFRQLKTAGVPEQALFSEPLLLQLKQTLHLLEQAQGLHRRNALVNSIHYTANPRPIVVRIYKNGGGWRFVRNDLPAWRRNGQTPQA